MPSRGCIQYVSKSGWPSSGLRTGKGQSSSQFSRRVVKNMLTTRQLHSSPMLVSSCWKSCVLGICMMWTKNFQRFKLSLEKEEETDQIANIGWIIEKAREFQENIYFCFIDSTKAFDYVDHNKLWKALKEIWIPDCLTCFLRKLYAGQEAIEHTIEPCMKQLIGSKLRKEDDRAVCCHPVCLTYKQSTWWEMPGWLSYKLKSR